MNLRKGVLLLVIAMFALTSVADAQRTKSKSKAKKSVTVVKMEPAPDPNMPTAPSTVVPKVQQDAEHKFDTITVEELKERLAKNAPVFIIDSRGTSSYNDSEIKIKGAVRIPLEDIESRLSEIPRNREVVIYCTCPSEHTSGLVAQKLLAQGYKQVRALKGGWDAWVEAVGQVEPKAKPAQ